MHIVSLGPKGTYSDLVASKLKYKKISYTQNIIDICPIVLKEKNSRGVIPIENSTTGLILMGVDSINTHSTITISAEVEIPISFDLIANCSLAKIQSFFVQKEASLQCTNFIAKKLKKVEVVFCNSNTDTIKNLTKNSSKNVAVIIPSYIAEKKEYQHYKRQRNIENHENNTTRFFIVKKGEKNLNAIEENTKVSVYFEFQKDEPSLLYKILKIFHYNKINLTMLSSRALPHKKWTYGFFVDFQINKKKEIHKIPKIINKITTVGAKINILGVYKNIAIMNKLEIQQI